MILKKANEKIYDLPMNDVPMHFGRMKILYVGGKLSGY